MEGLKRLIHEIHRRSLWQVLLIYLVGAWVVFEVVQTLTEGLGLPTWFPGLALVLLLIGLPIVLATAFVQEGVRSPPRSDPTLIPTRDAAPGSERPVARPAGVRRLFTWRNALLGGTIALAAWGLVAALWLVAVGPPDHAGPVASGPVSSRVIAVLPFSYQGSQEYAYLGEGVADLLSTKLDGAGELRSVDPRAVLSFLGERAESNLDASAAAPVAQTLAAGRFVLGSIVEAGGRLTLSAALYEVGKTPEPLGEAEADGRAEEVFEVVDDLAAELLAGLGTGPAARARRIAAVTTNSLPALKAYLEGERAYRLGQYQDAAEDFERAVGLDTTYALAYYRLSILAEYVTLAGLAQQAAEQAVRFAGRLPERDRRMFEAFLAWRRGAHGEAERLYRSLVGSYPDEVEAWFELGEVLFHSSPFHGRSFTEGREPFERVLFYDPDNTGALYHLARIAAFEERTADMDSLVVRHNALIEDGDRELEMLALQAFARAEPELEDAVVERLARAPDVIIALATWDVAAWTKNLDGAMRLAGLMADPSRSLEVRTVGHVWLVHMRLAKGQYRAARAELDQMAALDSVAALEYRALLTAFPYMPADEAELRDLLARLAALDPHAVAPSGNPSIFFSAHDGLHPVLLEYLLGILNVQLGEYERAESHARALDSLPGPPGTGTMLSDFATSIRAQVLLTQGRPLEALARLEGVQREIWYNVAIASTFWAQPLERFLLAETLLELGRDDEAIPWYVNVAQVAPFEVAHRSIAYLRLGEIYERKGEGARAAEYYGRFVDSWDDADPELQPHVEAARRALSSMEIDR